MGSILIWVVLILIVLLVIGMGVRSTSANKQSKGSGDTESRSEPNEYLRATMYMSSEEKSRYLDGLLAQEELESRNRSGKY